MRNYFLVMLICVASLLRMANAQSPAIMISDKPGWHKISETTVDFKADKDEIAVLGADKFKAVRFKVTDASMHIEDIEVYYSNGDKENFKLYTDVKQGEESKVINFKAPLEIKKVVFVYSSLPNKKQDKAHVELYGLK